MMEEEIMSELEKRDTSIMLSRQQLEKSRQQLEQKDQLIEQQKKSLQELVRLLAQNGVETDEIKTLLSEDK